MRVRLFYDPGGAAGGATLDDAFSQDFADPALEPPEDTPADPPAKDPAAPGEKPPADTPADPPKDTPKPADPPPADDETEEQTPEAFYGEVEKLTGIPVQVEYPENIDPLSPEGVAIRDKTLLEQGALQLEEFYRTSDPRAYAYWLHRKNGGSDEDFLSAGTKGFTLPAETELAESADIQERVYRYDLRSRDLDEDTINTLVQKAITDNKLKDRATASYKMIDKAQKDQLRTLETATTTAENQFKDDVKTINTKIDSIIPALSYKVPEAQVPEFKKFILDNLQYDNGKFFIVQPVGDSLQANLDALLYQFMKGDMSKLISNAAKTQAAQRLRLGKSGIRPAPAEGGSGGNNGTGTLTLGEI